MQKDEGKIIIMKVCSYIVESRILLSYRLFRITAKTLWNVSNENFNNLQVMMYYYLVVHGLQLKLTQRIILNVIFKHGTYVILYNIIYLK